MRSTGTLMASVAVFRCIGYTKRASKRCSIEILTYQIQKPNVKCDRCLAILYEGIVQFSFKSG